MRLYCRLLGETASVSKPKTKKNCKKNSARIVLWSDQCAHESAYDQTSVRSNWPLIRQVCAQNCLWSDRPRPTWPLIRQDPDHCPDKSALEFCSRPCISSAPRTCVRSKMVWSEVTSVWPPRPGYVGKKCKNKIYIYETIKQTNKKLFANWL